MENYNIAFNNLYTITNMPIARFGSMLISKKSFASYMNLLKNNYNDGALKKLMCKSLISIDYKGYVYDCDFNQMLDLNIKSAKAVHVSDLDNYNMPREINTADHCYGCTAGSGSSCGGILV